MSLSLHHKLLASDTLKYHSILCLNKDTQLEDIPCLVRCLSGIRLDWSRGCSEVLISAPWPQRASAVPFHPPYAVSVDRHLVIPPLPPQHLSLSHMVYITSIIPSRDRRRGACCFQTNMTVRAFPHMAPELFGESCKLTTGLCFPFPTNVGDPQPATPRRSSSP